MNQAEYNDIFEEIISNKIREILLVLDGLNDTQILDNRERIVGQLSILTSVSHVVLSQMYEAGVNEAMDRDGDIGWNDVTKMLHAIVDNDEDAITLLQAQHKVRSIG